jgi:hypothetical protein
MEPLPLEHFELFIGALTTTSSQRLQLCACSPENSAKTPFTRTFASLLESQQGQQIIHMATALGIYSSLATKAVKASSDMPWNRTKANQNQTWQIRVARSSNLEPGEARQRVRLALLGVHA